MVMPSSLMVNLMPLIVSVCVCAHGIVCMFLCAALRQRGCLNELLAQLFLEPSPGFRYSGGMLSLSSCPRFLSLSYSLRLILEALPHLSCSSCLPSSSFAFARLGELLLSSLYRCLACPQNLSLPLFLFLPTVFSLPHRSTHRPKYDPPPPPAFYTAWLQS